MKVKHSLCGDSSHMMQFFPILVTFMAAYIMQPVVIDIIKFNGGAHGSTFLILIPHYLAMICVKLIPTRESIWKCSWAKSGILSALDIFNQIVKKAGLLLCGAAAYIVVDSSSIIWTAIFSKLILGKELSYYQWLAISGITFGITLKASTLSFKIHNEEIIGVILVLIASILTGLTYTLSEKFVTGASKIEGPNLVGIMGICCCPPLMLWTVIWTLPNRQTVIYDQIIEKNGSGITIILCFLFLFVSEWVHSAILYRLMQNLGAVTTGVLRGLKVAGVFLLSHFLFCNIQPSQCFNMFTGLSALTCTVCVVAYSWATVKNAETCKNVDVNADADELLDLYDKSKNQQMC